MIHLHQAIYALNPSITFIRGEDAFDVDGNLISYDKAQAEANFQEMQAAEESAKQAQQASKASALAKLSALGLTEDEIKALVG